MTTTATLESEHAIPDVVGVPRVFLRVTEAAKYLGTTRATLDTWRSTGKGPRYRRIGARIFYTVGDLDDWILSHPVIDPTKRTADTV